MNDDLEGRLEAWGDEPVPPPDPLFADRLERDLRSQAYFSSATEEPAPRRWLALRPAVLLGAGAVMAVALFFGVRTGDDQRAPTLPADQTAIPAPPVSPTAAPTVTATPGPSASPTPADAAPTPTVAAAIVPTSPPDAVTQPTAAPTAITESTPTPAATEPTATPEAPREPTPEPAASATAVPTARPTATPTTQPAPTRVDIELRANRITARRARLVWVATDRDDIAGWEVAAITADGTRRVAVLSEPLARTLVIQRPDNLRTAYVVRARDADGNVIGRSNLVTFPLAG